MGKLHNKKLLVFHYSPIDLIIVSNTFSEILLLLLLVNQHHTPETILRDLGAKPYNNKVMKRTLWIWFPLICS